MLLSVIVCTHNPCIAVLESVLQALKKQTLRATLWELVIVDNNSDFAVSERVDLSWHPAARVIRESKLGLSYARIAGVFCSNSSLIVFVDDDNVLNPQYLETAHLFFRNHPSVGVFGGRSEAVYETSPPEWFFQTGIDLGCQDYGDELHISSFRSAGFRVTTYPSKAPIGTGMVIRKDAFLAYASEVEDDNQRLGLGRRGSALTSGEDNDIILTVVEKGFEIAYVPQLIVQHLIPQKRYAKSYLKNLAYESNRSWIKVLHMHGISPWRPISRLTVPLRLAKLWISMRPWQSDLSSIRFSGSCGKIRGQSEI